MALYTVIIIYILYSVGFWKAYLLKDTIIWFLFTATISAFRAIEKGRDLKYFLTSVKDYIKVTLIFEFIANMYTFSLLCELSLIPGLFIIGAAIALLEVSPDFQNEKSKPLKIIFKLFAVGLGLFNIINSIVLAIKDIGNFASISNLKDNVSNTRTLGEITQIPPKRLVSNCRGVK